MNKIAITELKNGTFKIQVQRYGQILEGIQPNLSTALRTVDPTWQKLLEDRQAKEKVQRDAERQYATPLQEKWDVEFTAARKDSTINLIEWFKSHPSPAIWFAGTKEMVERCERYRLENMRNSAGRV